MGRTDGHRPVRARSHTGRRVGIVSGEQTLADYESKGMRQRTGFGSHPCVLVIDYQYGMTDPECPLGSAALDAPIEVSQGILAAARAAGVGD